MLSGVHGSSLAELLLLNLTFLSVLVFSIEESIFRRL